MELCVIKLDFNDLCIGDLVATTGLPENIYHATGKKCVIFDDRVWPFVHNPYVIYQKELEISGIPNITVLHSDVQFVFKSKFIQVHSSQTAQSQTELICFFYGIHDVILHHPRLYIYEDERIETNKIVVHTTGSDRFAKGEAVVRKYHGEDSIRVMSDNAIEAILLNYKDYKIVQIGGLHDKPLGGHSIDLRGKLSLWQTAKEIASSSKFIGVNSGPMHIANCYPKVIMLQEFSQESLMRFQPGDMRNFLFQWLDPAHLYFNKYERDISFTKSYNKI